MRFSFTHFVWIHMQNVLFIRTICSSFHPIFVQPLIACRRKTNSIAFFCVVRSCASSFSSMWLSSWPFFLSISTEALCSSLCKFTCVYLLWFYRTFYLVYLCRWLSHFLWQPTLVDVSLCMYSTMHAFDDFVRLIFPFAQAIGIHRLQVCIHYTFIYRDNIPVQCAPFLRFKPNAYALNAHIRTQYANITLAHTRFLANCFENVCVCAKCF